MTLKTNIFTIGFLIFSIFAMPMLAKADPATTALSPTCNGNILQSIEMRGWLEAEREVVQNQNIIVKPDSVMEYTCFDSHLNNLALNGAEIFSENLSDWSGASNISDDDMDNALNNMVWSSANGYLEQNFGHTLLGGRSAINYPLPSSVNGADYTCDIMDKIWEVAKCYNFQQLPNDGFMEFDKYATTDNRMLPTPCGAADSRVIDYVIGTYVSPDWAPEMKPAVKASYDNATLYNLVRNCGGSSRVIKTGIRIFDDSPSSPRNDAICLNPGCAYNGTNACTPI